MVQYLKNKPIILYSKLIDVPDTDKDVKGIPDTSILQDVKVVIIRPSGDRHSTLIPVFQNIDGFGKWYTTTLNLNFTDELGEWKIRWIYKTSETEIISEYVIDIVSTLITPYWCFQARNEDDDTLPDDVREIVKE